jgi:heterodisulfide reductase subunit C
MTEIQIKTGMSRKDIYECYQCAQCTGCCPALEVAPEAYGPREAILKWLDHGREKMVRDDRIWLCCTCNVCEERCPQMLPLGDFLVALRNSAARRGNVPDKLVAGIRLLAMTGRLMIVHQLDEMRAHHGLEPLPQAPSDEVRAILMETGLDEVVDF